MTQDAVTALFCDVDDFIKNFKVREDLESLGPVKKTRLPSLNISEIMTILILFHSSQFRTFKHYYLWLTQYGRGYFPDLVSYNRFIQLAPTALTPLLYFLNSRKGSQSGVAFMDSMPLRVCNIKRAKRNKVFEGIAHTSKSTMGWFHGFKIHLIINDVGELLSFHLSPANTDDRKPVRKMTEGIFGKLFADKGYISKKLFEDLLECGLKIVTPIKKNMKNALMEMEEKILLRKRSLIETVNDQLKNISQIDHTRHRSVLNYLSNVICALIAYTYQPKKPSLKFLKHIIPGISTSNEEVTVIA